jgi:hypothetical protein
MLFVLRLTKIEKDDSSLEKIREELTVPFISLSYQKQ